MSSSDAATFIRANTAISSPSLVPEIRLHLANEITPLWQATEATLARDQLPPPYWAFAWAGGQALARHVLDHAELVRGKRVLDFRPEPRSTPSPPRRSRSTPRSIDWRCASRPPM